MTPWKEVMKMTLREEQEKVQAAVSHSLADLREDPWLAQRVLANAKGEEPVKKKLSATMVLVIVLVTITTAALAVAAGKYFGWFDFYSEFYGVEVPEVAQQVMKDSGERQFTLGPVTFTVGELYCDGYTAMASAKISLAEGDDALVTGDAPNDCIGINSEGGDAYADALGLPRETTWAEAAKQLDRRLYIVDAMLEMPEELYGSESMFGAMTGSDGQATCFSMYSMNGKAYGEKVDATMYLNVKEYDAERETFSEIAEEYEHLPIFLEAPIDTKEYELPENTVIVHRFRLDSVKAVWMDAGMYVVSSFTALDGATEELAEELLGEVEPVQENGEGYPSGLNLTDTIQETSGWPEITTWRMTSVNGIPETLFLTIPEAGGERTKIELKLKEE